MTQTLKVSLSTDAVIYLPFYLAYFGGDFKDTPYGAVDIQIVGLNDIRFKYYEEELETTSEGANAGKNKSPRLRGDAFMTLDVLLGMADIGIGDTGFVNILRNNVKLTKDIFTGLKDENGKTVITQYIDLLNEDIAKPLIGVEWFDKNENTEYTKLESAIKKTDLKISAGLVRKPALKGIIKSTTGLKDLGVNLTAKDLISNKSVFDKLTKQLKIYTYNLPSTSYHFLETKLKEQNKDRGSKFSHSTKIICDFGEELNFVTKDTICISCDLVGLRYANKTNAPSKNTDGVTSSVADYSEFFLVEDFTCESNPPILWSGIIMDNVKYKKSIADKSKNENNAYKAFFYCVDKCLSEIDRFLSAKDSAGLHYYIKSKLTSDKNKITDVFRVLIADAIITAELTKKNEGNLEINMDLLIRWIVKDLFYCVEKGERLYYSSLNISKSEISDATTSKYNVSKEHIKELCKLRDDPSTNIDNSLLFGVMDDWYKQETKIKKFKDNWWTGWLFRFMADGKFIESISVLIVIIGIVSFIEPFIKHWMAYENTNNRALKMATFMVLIFLIVAIFFLVRKLFIPKLKLVKKIKYVYRKK